MEYDPRRFTCPVGGAEFEQEVGYYAFPLLTLPDGSWLGDEAIDAQIPLCPGNGLVILPDYAAMEGDGQPSMAYRAYTPAEIGRLPALIADPDYVALKRDGRHAQAYWLATKLGLPPSARFDLLQRATWAAVEPALRRRLVERLAADGPSLIEAARLPGSQARMLNYHIVNALRELGRFDEALALLERIEAGGPPVQPPGQPHRVYGLEEIAPQLRLAIGGKDDGRFPIELLDRRLVDEVCEGGARPPFDQRTAGTLRACKVRREREARESAEGEAAFDEALALEEAPEILAGRCDATPPDKRSKGLATACEAGQSKRDEKAAVELARDGAKLAASCDSTPEVEQKGPLFHACISYGIAVEAALADAFTGDDQA